MIWRPVGADADLTQAPTFDCPTIGGCYPATSNGFKVLGLSHRRSADWINLASASTACVRVVAGPMEAAQRQGITRRRHMGRRILAGPSAPDRSPADLSLHPKADSSATVTVFRPTLSSSACRGEGEGRLKSLSSQPTPRRRLQPYMTRGWYW